MFVPLKVPEFLKNKKTKKNPLVLPCCVHCARFDILSSFFSETKSKPAKTNTGECFTTYLKHMQKTQALLKGKKITRKVT